MAANCCVPLATTVALGGEITIEERVALTVAVTELVVVRPLASRIVTTKPYVPALANVAVTLLEALVPFEEKVTAAGGVPVVVQVYVRFDSPPSSAPKALRFVACPVTGLALAEAGGTTVGACVSFC